MSATVDSEPWFWFVRSAWSPSNPPPVQGIASRQQRLGEGGVRIREPWRSTRWRSHPGTSEVVTSRSDHLQYTDHGYEWELSGRNGFFSPFAYEGCGVKAWCV